MNVGVGLPNTTPGISRQLIVNWAKQADKGPFTSLGVFDRLVYNSYDPLTTLAAVAPVTQNIRLAITIIISPLRNTAMLAKFATTIHALSNGRLVLGLVVGARTEDYNVAQVNF